MTRRTDLPPANAKPNAGRWRRGESGNPAGRKAGSRNRATLALDAIGQVAGAEIVQRVIAEALDGNLFAAGLILQRVWPIRRGAPVRLALPSVETAADLPRAIAAVTAAVAAGELTPDEGSSIVTIMEAQRRTIETCELEKRITDLEERYNGSK